MASLPPFEPRANQETDDYDLSVSLSPTQSHSEPLLQPPFPPCPSTQDHDMRPRGLKIVVPPSEGRPIRELPALPAHYRSLTVEEEENRQQQGFAQAGRRGRRRYAPLPFLESPSDPDESPRRARLRSRWEQIKTMENEGEVGWNDYIHWYTKHPGLYPSQSRARCPCNHVEGRPRQWRIEADDQEANRQRRRTLHHDRQRRSEGRQRLLLSPGEFSQARRWGSPAPAPAQNGGLPTPPPAPSSVQVRAVQEEEEEEGNDARSDDTWVSVETTSQFPEMPTPPALTLESRYEEVPLEVRRPAAED